MVLRLEKGAEQAVKEMFKLLLEKKRVKGVFTLKRFASGSVPSYALITDPEEIESSSPLYPFMPVNAAQSLSRITLKEPFPDPVAAFIRPCELRAFVELVKLQQGSLENLFIMSSTCGGVFPLTRARESSNHEKSIEEELERYWKSVEAFEIPPGIRPTCRGCEEFLPYNSDITIALMGTDARSSCTVHLNTARAEELMDGIQGEPVNESLKTDGFKTLKKKRSAEREKLFSEQNIEDLGIDGLIDLYGRCLGCHGCSSVCPLCYCTLCFFDSKLNTPTTFSYETETDKRGGIRVPSKTLFYHIGRLFHVSNSCVGCGSCTDVCPVDIPLSTVFQKTETALETLYDYVPGRNLDEKNPLQLFREDELCEFEQ